MAYVLKRSPIMRYAKLRPRLNIFSLIVTIPPIFKNQQPKQNYTSYCTFENKNGKGIFGPI